MGRGDAGNQDAPLRHRASLDHAPMPPAEQRVARYHEGQHDAKDPRNRVITRKNSKETLKFRIIEI